jgi:hypothetical protein
VVVVGGGKARVLRDGDTRRRSSLIVAPETAPFEINGVLG